MWVKCSDGGIGTLTQSGIAGLYTGILYDLKEGETVVSRKIDLISVLKDETSLNGSIQQDKDRKV